jgi:hypothetical protein
MKKIIIYTVVIIILALSGWLFFGNNPIKKYIDQGRKIERLRLQVYWDSINYSQVAKVVEGLNETNKTLQDENKAIRDTESKIRVQYETKIKALEKLTGKEIDSIFVIYAKDSLEAIENFISLDECREISMLRDNLLSNCQKINTNNNQIISELKAYIETNKNQTIELRNANAELSESLLISEGKLKRRTIQRNMTWAGLAVIIAGLVVLK